MHDDVAYKGITTEVVKALCTSIYTYICMCGGI